jgi:hypothetical protein
MMFVLHRKHIYRPPQAVTGIALPPSLAFFWDCRILPFKSQHFNPWRGKVVIRDMTAYIVWLRMSVHTLCEDVLAHCFVGVQIIMAADIPNRPPTPTHRHTPPVFFRKLRCVNRMQRTSRTINTYQRPDWCNKKTSLLTVRLWCWVFWVGVMQIYHCYACAMCSVILNTSCLAIKPHNWFCGVRTCRYNSPVTWLQTVLMLHFVLHFNPLLWGTLQS